MSWKFDDCFMIQIVAAKLNKKVLTLLEILHVLFNLLTLFLQLYTNYIQYLYNKWTLTLHWFCTSVNLPVISSMYCRNRSVCECASSIIICHEPVSGMIFSPVKAKSATVNYITIWCTRLTISLGTFYYHQQSVPIKVIKYNESINNFSWLLF